MTKKHFQAGAADIVKIVKAILQGHWTHEAPAWVPANRVYGTADFEDNQPLAYYDGWASDAEALHYTRAVQTAEALIMLFEKNNPEFDTHRFLVASGLVEPVKKGKKR